MLMDSLWVFVPIAIICFLIGSSVGSFLNVIIYRLPANLSIVWPPSRCPQCLHQLSKQDNIPVFGWFLLLGRCRYCKTPISFRYPLVEIVTGLLFVIIFVRYDYSLLTLGYWILVSWLIILAMIDFDTMILPNSLTKSGVILGIIFQLVIGYYQGTMINSLLFGVGGMVLGIWLFDIIGFLGLLLFQKEAMGGGDSKLAAMMGVWLGSPYLLVAIFLAALVGVSAGGGLRALGMFKPIPFGPFLAIGTLLAVLMGNEFICFYEAVFFPSLNFCSVN